MNQTTCYHCGDYCNNQLIKLDSRSFCCQGCKTVYEILHQNGLDQYYDLTRNPGVKALGKVHSFDYLDEPAVARELHDFTSPAKNKVTFHIPAIHCSSCIWLLEHLYKLNPGIIDSKVNFSTKKLYLTYHPEKVSLSQVVYLLSSLGYEPIIGIPKSTKSAEKNLLIKIGIAGFSFGNIMLLAWPDYFGYEVDPTFSSYFGIVSLILSLPVMFYSATEYFQLALKGLKKRYVNVDVPISIGIIAIFAQSIFEIISGAGNGYFDSLAGLVFFLLIGKWIQGRTYSGLAFDRDYKSYFPIAVLKKEKEQFKSVKIEDLEKGDLIRIRHGEIIPADARLTAGNTLIDYSFVTGESEAVHVREDERVFAGGKQLKGSILLEVLKPVSQSYLTSLWKQFDLQDRINHHPLVDKVSHYFTPVVLLIAVLTAVYWTFSDPSKTWFAFSAVLIVACPCALALATPFTLGTVMNIFGKNSFYLKSPQIVETMARINHLVFDKTGTLSKPSPETMEYDGDLTEEEMKLTKSLVGQSLHPYSRAIDQFVNQNPGELEVHDFKEAVGKGISGMVTGTQVSVGSSHYLNHYSPGEVLVALDGKTRGKFKFQHHVRPGIKKLIEQLKSKYKMSLVSGDDEKNGQFFSNLFPNVSELKFSQSPHQKRDYIKDLRAQNDCVMMIGDGLNDAVALRESDVGVAATDQHAHFTPASDVIIEGSQIHRLPAFLSLARISKQVIILCFIISFIYNVGGLSFAVSGLLTPVIAAILMPLSSVTVVVVATLLTRYLAKHIGL